MSAQAVRNVQQRPGDTELSLLALADFFLIFNLLEQYSVSTNIIPTSIVTRLFKFRPQGMIHHRDWPLLAPHPLPSHPISERRLSVCEFDRLRTPQEHPTRTTRLASLLSILPSREPSQHVFEMPRCCYRPSVYNEINGEKIRFRKGQAYHG
jgi:hypothetical protein